MDFNKRSDNGDSSDDENEELREFKPHLTKLITKREIEQWRVSNSPIIKSASLSRKNQTPCEKLQRPCIQIKNMSPAKSEQLIKARRSLNLELCTDSEKNEIENNKRYMTNKYVIKDI